MAAGKLLPNHLETELDQQLANLTGCALLQFLFFLLQDVQFKAQDSSARSNQPHSHQQAILLSKQALESHGPEGFMIDDCSLAENDVRHKHQIKKLIGMPRPYCISRCRCLMIDIGAACAYGFLVGFDVCNISIPLEVFGVLRL